MTRIQQHANRVGLIGALLLAVLVAIILTSCATSRERRRIETRAYYDKRQVTTVDTTVWPVKNDATRYGRPPLGVLPTKPADVKPPVSRIGDLQGMVNAPTVTSTVTPKRTLFDKVLGRPAKPVATYAGAPRKVKGDVVINNNNVTGNQTNTTSTAGKKATTATGDGATTVLAAKHAQAAAADSGASLQQASSKQQAAAGKDISQQQVVPKKPFWETLLDNLTQPLGIVLALVVAAGAVWLVLWLRRGKKTADTLS